MDLGCGLVMRSTFMNCFMLLLTLMLQSYQGPKVILHHTQMLCDHYTSII